MIDKITALLGILFFLNIDVTAQEFPGCDNLDSVVVNADSNLKMTYEFSWDFEHCPQDLSKFRFIAFDIDNNSNSKAVIDLQYTSGKTLKNTGRFISSPNGSQLHKMMIVRQKPRDEAPWKLYFKEVRGYPGGYVTHWAAPNPSTINRITIKISLDKPFLPYENIVFKSPYGLQSMHYDSNTFSKQSYPIVDDMGQYVGDQWNGKIEKAADLKQLGNKDYESYNAKSFQSQFSKYGGWKPSVKQQSKGYFYSKKINGRWWLIDPEGFLFWSLGINGIGNGSATKTITRERLFPDLEWERSKEKSDYKSFYSEDSKIFRSDRINFYYLNLRRKYGDNWIKKHQEVTLGRLKKWGINTYGAWSNTTENLKHPYTIIIHPKMQGIGDIKKLPDPFSYSFKNQLKQNFQRHAPMSKDSWLVGIFVNNEIHWQHKASFSKQILSLKNTIPVRSAFEKFLKKKYRSIESLNFKWQSDFKSFKKISANNNIQHSNVFKKDMQAFFAYYVDAYYKLVRSELKKVFPNHLYLGSRLHGKSKYSSILHEKAAQYCDVVSFNIYDYSVRNFKLLTKIDKPIIIGEFHFGTASHGVWGSGLRNAASLENQANLYKQYISEASTHPNIVGAHWFQWSDQPVTGRFDGENFRIGIVNITDQPYVPLINAIEEVSKGLYLNRIEKN